LSRRFDAFYFTRGAGVRQEFEGGNWQNNTTAAEDAQLWQDDWEDDNVADDFTEHLRAQINARKAAEGK
jgi:hypothetical protein